MRATSSVNSASTVRPVPGYSAWRSASTSPLPATASPATVRTKAWNRSLRATKSVSELTSTTAPATPRVATPTRPSAATRPAFFAAAARPFLRSQSTAASRSPPLSPSARLQSIIPAPVLSRNSLTSAAVTSAIALILSSNRCRRRLFRGRCRLRLRFDRLLGSRLRREILDRHVVFRRNLGGSDLGARADIDAGGGQLRLQTVEHGSRNQVAIQMNRAHCIVVPGDRVGDPVGRRVRLE